MSKPELKWKRWVIARNTSTILRHTLHTDLFFGHNFCVLAPNDSRFIEKVLMTIIHLEQFFVIFKNNLLSKNRPQFNVTLANWKSIYYSKKRILS